MMGHTDQLLPFPPAHSPASQKAREHGTVATFLSGNSHAAAQLRAQIRRVAPYFRTLALTGEPGCGAPAAARALYQMCPLHDLPFVVLRQEDAEERFAPQDAGPAEQPRPKPSPEGMIFLPEAEKLSPAAQEGLLRTLRHQTSQSARIVAFVGRGLKPMISAGFFSPELAGLLGSLRIALPTLRERASDIPGLVHERLQQSRASRPDATQCHRPLYVGDDFLQAAVHYAWPGNLRQLHDAMDWLVGHNSGGTLRAADLTAAIQGIAGSASAKAAEARMVKLDLVIQEHIRAVLVACSGNKLRAAEVLGISRSTLYRMLDAADAPEMLLAG